MQPVIQSFWLQKAGNSVKEYEDASGYDDQTHVAAVADGASDSFESRLWASALVRAFVRRPPLPDQYSILEWLANPIRTWKEAIHWDNLAWYAEEKAARGAFSTLLGVSLIPSSNDPNNQDPACYRWRAIAIGDACLFQLRGDKLVMSFPVENAADFGTTPVLISTQLQYSQRSLKGIRLREGECGRGDSLLLTTDALAAWLLSKEEKGEPAWHRIRSLTREGFAEVVSVAREQGEMRNDDVTLLLLRHSDCLAPKLD